MKLTGKLENPIIHTYYVTGSLEQKTKNEPLQKMLKKIKDGGMNTFLNDSELKGFAQGLRYSFENDGYINEDGSITAAGEDIVNTGRAWHSLQGAFLFTVLRYKQRAYLLDAQLADNKNSGDNKNVIFDPPRPELELNYSEYAEKFRNIQIDKYVAFCKQQPKDRAVTFEFDYERAECDVTATFDTKPYKFTTKESSDFSIMKLSEAQDLLEERENKEKVLVYHSQDTKAVQIQVPAAEDIAKKSWLKNFFEKGAFSLARIHPDGIKGEINDIHLYIDKDDTATAEILLNEYLLRKAESTYLGYEETGRLVNTFQELFVSQEKGAAACPPIIKETKAVYDGLVKCAKDIAAEHPNAYLHLQAYIDLAPANTLKPYIEKDFTMNLTNQEISFNDLVGQIFGEERNITAISALSKYTASNGRNARAFMLLAESIAQKFGQKLTLITTEETANSLPGYRDSDKKWFEKMQGCKHIQLNMQKRDGLKDIHDRYFKITRSDSSVEWRVMTGELDTIRFENDAPRIREDIRCDEKGKVKEMTVSKIKQDGVPDKLVKIMEEK